MSKELIVSSNRHETRVAVLEDDQVVEVYYQRENEYSLAGSIHKGRVTRVLPGMQSAFVDIGLDRDAFLYVSDFFEDNEEYDKIVTSVEEKVLKLEKGPAARAPLAAAQVAAAPPAEAAMAEPPAAARRPPVVAAVRRRRRRWLPPEQFAGDRGTTIGIATAAGAAAPGAAVPGAGACRNRSTSRPGTHAEPAPAAGCRGRRRRRRSLRRRKTSSEDIVVLPGESLAKYRGEPSGPAGAAHRGYRGRRRTAFDRVRRRKPA